MNNDKLNVDFVLICICSYKRPRMLRDALSSINSLKMPENIRVELLLVDNDSKHSGKAVYDEIAPSLKIKSHYVCEDNQGIANARNRILEESINLGASHILFFDDDEYFDENCLCEHIKMYKDNEKAVIISGPVKSVFKPEYPEYIKKHIVFKQLSSKEQGEIKETCATGNVFFPITIIKKERLRFNSDYVYIGGEDGEFFKRASRLGYTIVWNKNAIIYETVSPARANLKYILRKCYYNGYSKSFTKFKRKECCRFCYISKELFVLFCNSLCFLFSILGGLSCFFNALGILCRTFGKIDGAIKGVPYEFYKNVYGE